MNNNYNFEEKVKSVYGDLFEVIFYKDYYTKAKIKHIKCGKTFECLPNEFTRKRVQQRFLIDECPNCRIKGLTFEQCNNQIKEITKNRIEMIGEFKNTHKKALMKCKVCNYEFRTEPHTLMGNVKTNLNDTFGCPKCSKKKKKTTKEFKQELFDLYGEEYEVLGEYKTNHTKIKLKHKKCNKEYYAEPYCILYNKVHCPCELDLVNSKNVKFIEGLFIKNKIKYEREKRFDNCKNKNTLPFDFYLEEFNCLIEYDGEQHFKNGFIYNELENIRKRDKIKNQYCIDNDINFIRIPYKLNQNEIKEIIIALINEEFDYQLIEKYTLLVNDVEDNKTYNLNKYYELY